MNKEVGKDGKEEEDVVFFFIYLIAAGLLSAAFKGTVGKSDGWRLFAPVVSSSRKHGG